MKRRIKYYLNTANDSAGALSNNGIYDMKDIEKITYQRLDDYSNEFLVIIEYSERG